MKKKLVSLLMALIMVVSLLPTAAFAAESVTATIQTSTSVGGLDEGNAFGTATLSNGIKDVHWMCMWPEGNPPAVGHKFSAREATGLYRVFAWMAQNTSTSTDAGLHRLWNIHHAVSELNGTNNNVFYAEQQAVYKEAQNYDTSKIPSNFVAYAADPTTSSGDQICLMWGYEQNGTLKLIKTSTNTAITSGNSNYSLAGAVYRVYKNSDLTGYLSGKDLTTKSDGVSNTVELEAGTYYVKEYSAPDGFKKNNSTYTVVVAAGKPNEVKVSDEPDTVSVNLKKSSANTTISNNKPSYSLAGAKYGVYLSESDAERERNSIGTLTTKADGTTNTLTGLAMGKYWCKELQAPPGYKKDTTPHSVTVTTPGATGTFKVTDTPMSDPVDIILYKQDAETGTNGQGSVGVKGAEYTVKFYAGQFKTADEAIASGSPLRTWVLMTDEDGYCQLHEDYRISGSDFYLNDKNQPTLPLGTVVIQETKAPDGYKIDPKIYFRNIKQDGTNDQIVAYNAPTSTDTDAIHGGLNIVKKDIDLKTATPQGAATLKGAKYNIINLSDKPVHINGTNYATNKVCYTLTTDEKGAASIPATVLPAAKYKIVEVTAPNGYKLDGGHIEKTFSITTDGQVVKLVNDLDDPPMRGGVEVQKYDSETGKTPQGDAKFANTVFNIVSLNDNPVVVDGVVYHKNDVVKTLKTDENGYAKTSSKLLPYGDYKMVEVEAPEGYLLEGSTEKTFSITSDGQMVDLKGALKDDVSESVIRIVKHNDNGETGVAHPEANAVFQVYLASAGSYENAKKTERDLLTTDKDGFAVTKSLPYGRYIVHQVSGAEGYGMVKDFTVFAKDDGEIYSYILNNMEFYGYLKLTKTDSKTGKVIPIEGVSFKLKNPAGEYITWRGKDTWQTDKKGIVEFPMRLAYGYNYAIEEITTPTKGYVLPTEPVYFDMTPETADEVDGINEVSVTFENTSTTTSISKRDVSGEEIPGAKMTLLDKDGKVVEEWTSTTEPHIIDELYIGETYTLHEDLAPLGYVKASDITFTVQNTTDVQKVFMTDKVVNASKEDYTGAKVPGATLCVLDADGKEIDKWTTDDGVHAINNLEVGKTYTLRELKAPEGYITSLDSMFTVTDDGVDQTVVMENELIPEIHTTATVNDNNVANAVDEVTLVDVVHYEKLVPGRSYTVTGKLMDKVAGKAVLDAEGKEIISTVPFTAEATTGDVEVTFVFDASGLAGHSVVVFEDLYRGDRLYCTHADLNDEDQTVHFPEIGTTAAVEGVQTALPQKNVTLVDTVSYKNLVVGKEYTVNGTLMDQATEEALVDAEGNEITATATFTATEENGSVDVTFTFDASEFAGRSVVAFEDMYNEDTLIAVHADITDKGQTVNFPELHTTATAEDIHTAIAKENITLVDTVNYKNLTAGKEYTVSGKLMNQTTGEAVLDAEGKEITSSATFTAENANGSVDVTFVFDATIMAGESAVVFEDMYQDDILVATHADITDEDQTVHFPEIHTTATVNDKHVANAAEEVTLIDAVEYTNLIVGKEYTVNGVLMNQASGKAMLDAAGNEITATTTFVAEEANGVANIEFTFDGSNFAGSSVVAFEEIYTENVLVAVHADISDEGQTVHFPEIHTTATVNDIHTAMAQDGVTLVDTVMYKNLVVGKDYTVNGVLMDKKTGKALRDADGNKITAEATFTATEENGSVDVTFVFDATFVAGRSVVAFEEMYNDNTLVAVHADLEDEDQTVHFPEIHTTAAVNGSHVATATKRVKLVDTVTYTNLIVGQRYTVTGTLMNKKTGTPFVYSNGKPVTVTKTFVPKQANGTVDVVFRFNGEKLGGYDVVVFENIYHGDELVATHADINDLDQTVHFDEPDVPQTGDNGIMIYAIAAAVSITAGAAIIFARKRKEDQQ